MVMKTIVSVVLVLLSVSIMQAAEYRVFTDAQGRAIEAKIIAHDSVEGLIQVERTDGRRVWVQPALFSPDDQTHIREWIDAYRVLSEDNLRVAVEKIKVRTFKKGMTDEERTREAVESEVICYEITLQNRSRQPIADVKIEYRLYVETDADDLPENVVKGTKPEILVIDRIEPGKRISVRTGNLVLEKKFKKEAVYEELYMGGPREFKGYDIDKISEDDLLGIWLRINGPPLDGEPTIRDVSEPEDLAEDVDWER
jgi:hypothetical protein